MQVEDGIYTVYNPATGGHRSIRVSQPEAEHWKGFWNSLKEGTRIAEFMSMGRWSGFAFIHPNGNLSVWRRRAGFVDTEVAALKYLLGRGSERQEELRENFDRYCGCKGEHRREEVAKPSDPLEQMDAVARQRWEGQ